MHRQKSRFMLPANVSCGAHFSRVKIGMSANQLLRQQHMFRIRRKLEPVLTSKTQREEP